MDTGKNAMNEIHGAVGNHADDLKNEASNLVNGVAGNAKK
jgi:hypothetical protein